MRLTNLPIQIASLLLILTGAALMTVSIVSGGTINVALPLVFLVLGGGFFILVFRLRDRLSWSPFLYIPAFLFSALGIIFFLNVLTQDWNSWAYAWLLPVAAVGIGLLFANRPRVWHPVLPLVGWILALSGAALFGVFGVIAGGFLIQILAPVFLIAAGAAYYWLRMKPSQPVLPLTQPNAAQPNSSPKPVDELVEPLSTREIEVLRLIEAGYTNQQIADKLSVASSTVKTHINNIYGKLGVQTRVQAVNRSRELGLFEQ